MAMGIWPKITGIVGLRDFDRGVIRTMDGTGFVDDDTPCFSVAVPYPDGSVRNVPVYFAQPETIFRKKHFPFITVNRDNISLAMHRWMNVGQLEYRAGVSGTQMMINGVSGFSNYQAKQQAWPYDFTYTISAFDRYENGVQPILLYLLKHFPPLGKLFVIDSLGLPRTYEAYLEGDIANLQELTDPVNRSRGYALTIRVEGELDLADPYTTSSVSGIDLYLHRMN